MSKKKLTITISAVCAVLLVAVIAAVAVFAALQTSATSSFKVTYTAQNVEATISGAYYKTGTKVADLKAGEATSIVFDGSETAKGEKPTNVKAFDAIENIELKASDYVVFEYVITNTDDTNKTFAVNAQKTGTLKNLSFDYLVADEAQTITKDTEMTEMAEGAQTMVSSMGAGVSQYVYFRVVIENDELDASFDGGIDFTLSALNA